MNFSNYKIKKKEPASFAEQFLEATHIENVISDDDSITVVKKAAGMKTNVYFRFSFNKSRRSKR